MFVGSIPALVTPFAAGRVNEAAFRDLVEWQIDEGSNALVPCGTTGEAATLSTEEQRQVIEITVEVARGRVPVIAGCGSNNTAHAIELTHSAREAGADAALHVPPYYNRPNQEGIYAHLAAVADLEIPIILYNVPSRTITDISVETMGRLSRLPNVIGVKDATGNLGRVSAQRLAAARSSCSSAATTKRRWPSTPWAASAASPSPPMSPRASAPNSRKRCAREGGTRR